MLLITSFAVLRNTAWRSSSEIPTFMERNSRNETGQSSLKPELLSQRDYLYLQ